MKIYSDDGREFKNQADCNDYETKLKLQKEKEEAERKEKERRAEEVGKIKEANKHNKLHKINQLYREYAKEVKDYEKTTGEKTYFVMDKDGEYNIESTSCLTCGNGFYYLFENFFA